MRSAMEELEAIAFARATDVLREEEGKQVVCWDTDATAAIAGLEQSGGVWKVKFYDKLKALELLLRARGELDFGHSPGDSGLFKAILSATKGNLDGVQDSQPQAAGGDDLVEQGKPEKL